MRKWAALAAATVAVFASAPLLGAGTLNLGVTLFGYLAIAQAWNVLAGFGGQVSLGSAAFVATGGYTAALILVHTGLGWPQGGCTVDLLQLADHGVPGNGHGMMFERNNREVLDVILRWLARREQA